MCDAAEYKRHKELFRKSSKTYYYSSVFFPSEVRCDVFRLYSFVRTADNYVDSVPQQTEEFYSFLAEYRKALRGEPTDNQIIDAFVSLSKRKNFEPAWTDAFLQSMEWDLSRSEYETEEEMLKYIYGSAEVIGLYMSAILGLSAKAHRAAVFQGRAMQLINFIRDIDEDNGFGRRYLPSAETDLLDLSYASAQKNPKEFERYIRFQIDRYRQWQAEATKGFSFLPRRYRIPVSVAADMYNWTASVIWKDPFVVFSRKVKPGKLRVFRKVLWRLFFPAKRK